MKSEPPIFAVVGETASGKTSVAIKIAKQVNGEILCADSRTVYKSMNIGTAKPTIQEQEGVPHHLLDIVEPNERFTVVQFQDMAQKCIQDVKKRGKIPILTGGSGLYIDSVLYNFQFPKNPGVYSRDELEQMSDVQLTSLLNIHSLENSQLNTKNKRHVINSLVRMGTSGSRSPLSAGTLILGLKLDKAELRNRIARRVEGMFEAGFLDEVRKISDKYGWDNESMTGIGYRLARSYFDGIATTADVKEAFVKRDLSLAKRQRTWFKRNKDILWFDNPEDLISKAVEFAEQFDYNEANV